MNHLRNILKTGNIPYLTWAFQLWGYLLLRRYPEKMLLVFQAACMDFKLEGATLQTYEGWSFLFDLIEYWFYEYFGEFPDTIRHTIEL